MRDSKLDKDIIEKICHLEFVQQFGFILIVFLEYRLHIIHQDLILKTVPFLHGFLIYPIFFIFICKIINENKSTSIIHQQLTIINAIRRVLKLIIKSINKLRMKIRF